MKKVLAVLAFMLFSVSPVFALDIINFNTNIDLSAIREAAANINVPLPSQLQDDNSARTNFATPVQLKEWTVMVFMNGSGNLADWGMEDIRKMGTIGTTDKVNVVVETGLKMGDKSLVQRILLLPGEGKTINSVVYKTWNTRDMGNWRNAADFIKWAKVNFPAKRFLYIMQAHGGGFIDNTYNSKMSGKSISDDDLTHNYIKVPEMPILFKEAGYVDMFIMAACKMQTAEVNYEIGENVGVIIGSEESDQAFLFQSKERLGYLNANPQASTEQIATAFIEMRKRILTPGNEIYIEVDKSTVTVDTHLVNTLSAVRTSELKNLPSALDSWVNTLMAENEPDAILFAITTTVRFGVNKPSDQAWSQITDLGNFAVRVMYASKKQKVKDETMKLLTFLNQLIIANGSVNINYSGIDYSKELQGISIKMIPLTSVNQSILFPDCDVVVDTKYDDLMLSKNSQWNE